MPLDQIMTRSGQVEPHISRSYPRRVTEPHVAGFLTDKFGQVRWIGRRLKGKRLPIRELAVEGRR